MCGRFVQTSSPSRIAELLDATDTLGDTMPPRHNVAPSTPVPAVIADPRGGGRRLGPLRWGFVPSWARGPDDGPRPINARIEGVGSSRLFAPSLARRRAVVPVDAWFEWTEEDGARQPWLLRPRAGGPVPVAAVWSVWRAPDAPADAAPLATVALLTTEALGTAAGVHHRMPVLVPPDLLESWLDPAAPADGELLGALAGGTPDVDVVRVSRRVNDVRNDDPELLEPVG